MAGGQAAISLDESRKADIHQRSGKSGSARGDGLSKLAPGTGLCMVLVALFIILGGGGTVNPQTEMILQVLVALLIIPLVASAKWQRALGAVPRMGWLLGGLILLIPVLQLIPLPPAIWHGLPGRAIEVQALALVQADQRWMPWSMAPARTFTSLLSMIFPVLLLLQVSRLSVSCRTKICAAIVIGGILSLLLGVLQLSHTGGWEWSLYTQYSKGFLVGFQANRNAEADVLLISMLALGALVSARLEDGRHHAFTWAGLFLGLLAFSIGLFMTGSRTGIALGGLALVFVGTMLLPHLRNKSGAARWLAGILSGGLLAGTILVQLPSVQKVLDRFHLNGEARWDLWKDTWFAIQQVWPFGSGIGTIMPMLEAAERLDLVDTARPNRAHNDWLEWVLESGLPGLVMLGAILLVVGYIAARALIAAHRPDVARGQRAQVIFALGVLAITALHAIVDYPMRCMAIAALVAIAAAFLLDSAASQRSHH